MNQGRTILSDLSSNSFISVPILYIHPPFFPYRGYEGRGGGGGGQQGFGPPPPFKTFCISPVIVLLLPYMDIFPTPSPLSQGYAAELQSVGATTGQLAADSSNVVTLIRTAFNVRHGVCGRFLWERELGIYEGGVETSIGEGYLGGGAGYLFKY